jgi:vacuolar-type H+-ATPase subunit E/Vma4
MTVEKIIKQIKKDSQKEINQIQKESEKEANRIITKAKKEAEKEAEKILENGKQQSQNIKQILISQSNQDTKREIMKAREQIIDECFIKAHHELSILSESKYRKIVSKLIDDGCKKLEEKCTIIASRDIDKTIAKEKGLEVTDTIESTGGIILSSSDGQIIIDNTFDGFLKRERDKIRIKVGKLLFS